MVGSTNQEFPRLNRAYNAVFRSGHLSLGLVAPIEAHGRADVPTLHRHLERIQLAETLGFASVWLRDVPFRVPSFGDAGQVFDPFVYLGALAASTESIGLGVASIILPLRHPAHIAKAAASADVLSGGRMLLGVASGDRPEEYPAMGVPFPTRGERFRESVAYLQAMGDDWPSFDNAYGSLSGSMDMLPKPVAGRVPVLITGGSQQPLEWRAQHGDGWMTYPRDTPSQGRIVSEYRQQIAEHGGTNKPVMQSLYIDVVDEPAAKPHPIHLGFRSGTQFLLQYLRDLRERGINHVALNLRFNSLDVEETMRRLAQEVLPEFV